MFKNARMDECKIQADIQIILHIQMTILIIRNILGMEEREAKSYYDHEKLKQCHGKSCGKVM